MVVNWIRGLISLGLADFEAYTAQIKSKWLQFDLLHFENKVKMESHFPSLDQDFQWDKYN